MTNRRALLLALILALLVFGAFAAEASYRNRTCISAMMVDTSTTITVPEVCAP